MHFLDFKWQGSGTTHQLAHVKHQIALVIDCSQWKKFGFPNVIIYALLISETQTPSLSGDTISTASTISSADMRDILETLKWNCHRNSTKDQYYSAWKMFNNLFLKLDVKPTTWEEHISLFAAYLANNKRQSSTIKSYVSAIKAILFQAGVDISEDRATINWVAQACRQHTDRIKKPLYTYSKRNPKANIG